MTTVRGQNLKS